MSRFHSTWDNVEAKLVDGVLAVSVPKREAAEPRRIEITA